MKQTFTLWINKNLKTCGYPPVTDLYEDIKDGVVLYRLLIALNHEPPQINTKSTMKIFKIENLHKILSYIQESVKLVNISAEDIYEGNPKLVLGLIWSIILHLSLKDERDEDLKNKVYNWAKKIIAKYKVCEEKEFKDLLQNGMVYNTLLDYFTKEVCANSLDPENRLNNFKTVFEVAEECGIETLLDINELEEGGDLDEKCLFTYLLEYYTKFRFREGSVSANDLIIKLLTCIDTKLKYETKFNEANEEFKVKCEAHATKCNEINSMLDELEAKINGLNCTNEERKEFERKNNALYGRLENFSSTFNLSQSNIEKHTFTADKVKNNLNEGIEEYNNATNCETTEKLCDLKVVPPTTEECSSPVVEAIDGIKQQISEKFDKKLCEKKLKRLGCKKINTSKFCHKQFEFLPEEMTIEEILGHINDE